MTCEMVPQTCGHITSMASHNAIRHQKTGCLQRRHTLAAEQFLVKNQKGRERPELSRAAHHAVCETLRTCPVCPAKRPKTVERAFRESEKTVTERTAKGMRTGSYNARQNKQRDRDPNNAKDQPDQRDSQSECLYHAYFKWSVTD